MFQKPKSNLLAMAIGVIAHAAQAAEEPITFTAASGEKVEAFHGTFTVPEHRANPASRQITLSYVRFPATGEKHGNPIVYLAGGPGAPGSGTAERQRFPLFMALRQHGDVIAFDQRGTGQSTRLPHCSSSVTVPIDAPVSDAAYAALYRKATVECGAFWQGQGIDLAGYTTLESVQDLSALRQELGAERIALWGISYGTHLALAALKEIPDEIDRAVLASVEGLDQTVKLPARTDAYFARVQAAIDTQPKAKALYPDVAGLMRHVHARLDTTPMIVSIPGTEGETFLLQRGHLQSLASALIADPENIALLLSVYSMVDGGDATLAANLIFRFFDPRPPIGMSAMPTAMDMASGISEARFALVREQAKTALLADYLNFPMPHVAGVWPGLDLGDDFRTNPKGDTPVLVLSGTLDGRTYQESQREATAGLTNATYVAVRNAGHNLFMASPDVHQAIHSFLEGNGEIPAEIEIDLPDFTVLPPM
ncbi:alpha/beta fold hydrolase [Gimibacter soli]|uniref:Alpha/beta fold hydrolase n=1 Tax=Gimibacter soli TaxID=3024400 RepID=A0AAF0BL66_9PROT|nr:alpha/beta fold hydrolase [Gimibacter soli]WCL53777.1 alpha/beta fold hydrolase [Gimibacter soli]